MAEALLPMLLPFTMDPVQIDVCTTIIMLSYRQLSSNNSNITLVVVIIIIIMVMVVVVVVAVDWLELLEHMVELIEIQFQEIPFISGSTMVVTTAMNPKII